MKEYSLSLAEILALDIELNGQINPATGEQLFKGLLNQSLPLVAKYWLTKLAKTVGDEKAKIEALKNDLIKKHGKEEENGSIVIPQFLDEEGKQPNPAFVDYLNEFGTLLRETVTIQYAPIKLSLLASIETTETYKIAYNFVDDSQ